MGCILMLLLLFYFDLNLLDLDRAGTGLNIFLR
jgi:hypothetical protein